MGKIRVTRTVLIQEVIEYESDVNLPLTETVMEQGESFDVVALLLGKEMDESNTNYIFEAFEEEYISTPQIIKIEKL